jgi:hypothetical protein
MRLRLSVVLFTVLIAQVLLAVDKTSLGEVAEHAVGQSNLAAPGSAPFHLKATIVETTNPESDYRADIEEYWVSPDKWRRTIHSPEFSQVLVVNGDKTLEQNTGDYYPFWLHDLVKAIFDPLPMLEQLKKTNAGIAKPSGGEHSTSCSRFESKVGTPPAQMSEFTVICFEGRGLLESVVTPGYDAEFKEYRGFKGGQVARRIVNNPEPGTTLEARITELEELKNPDETLFTVQDSTPVAQRLQSIHVSDETLRSLSLNPPDIIWPTVRGGKTSGALSMYVSVDRTGHVREAWPLNSDNPNLDDSAREQVRKWVLKPAVVNGAPVQLEGILTFAFGAKVADAYPVLSDEEARKLATKIVEPVIPAGAAQPGTSFTVHILVGEDGTVHTVQNSNNVPTALFLAANVAFHQWRFRPYLRNGKPDVFTADITFHVGGRNQ